MINSIRFEIDKVICLDFRNVKYLQQKFLYNDSRKTSFGVRKYYNSEFSSEVNNVFYISRNFNKFPWGVRNSLQQLPVKKKLTDS